MKEEKRCTRRGVRLCLRLAVGLGTLLAIVLTGWCSFGRVCAHIRSQTLRLHVLANSDAPEDQQLKLQVRDALVQQCAALFDGADTLAEAQARAVRAMAQLQQTAEAVVRQAGYDYPVNLRLTDRYFDTRTYEEYTLPAGRYRALQVQLGAGEGHNWWCVLFPPLCIPAAQADGSTRQRETAEAVWGPGGVRLATGGYEVRFALLEWLEHWKEEKS